MKKELSLIKSEYLQEIENLINVCERVDDEKHNLNMDLKVINSSKKSKLFHLFCNATAKAREKSRIDFITVDNFPDCVFMEWKENDQIECYICELKVTPTNHLAKLKKQLFSGYLHCKTFLSILDVNLSEVKFNFLVFFVNDERNKEAEYNLLENTPKKVRPGEDLIPLTDYQLWKMDKLVFSNGEYKFDLDINKKKMEQDDDQKEVPYDIYCYEVNF